MSDDELNGMIRVMRAWRDDPEMYRLRDWRGDPGEVMSNAADALERLSAERDAMASDLVTLGQRHAQANADALRAEEHVLGVYRKQLEEMTAERDAVHDAYCHSQQQFLDLCAERDALRADAQRWQGRFQQAEAERNALLTFVPFLMGEEPLNGVWFAERHPIQRGLYWWRTEMRAALDAARGGEKQDV